MCSSLTDQQELNPKVSQFPTPTPISYIEPSNLGLFFPLER